MNERIKKLIELSGISVRGYYDETGSTPLELQKFTELIVKECADLVDDHDDLYVSYGDMIKQHFGVDDDQA